jgi:RHS repeat-associated protein
VGNWAATAVNGTTQTQAVSSMNEYSSFAGTPQGHSQSGNLTDDGERLFTWDFANRLIEVRKKADNSLIARYTYDAFNRRLTKITFATEEQQGGEGEYQSDSDTLGLYHFNDETGPVLDSSSFHNDGEAPRKIERGAEGLWDTKAVDMQGQAIRVRRPQGFDRLEDKLTVEIWVYLPVKECKDQKHKKHWKDGKDKHGKPATRCGQCNKNLKGGTLVRRPGSFRLRVQSNNGKAMFRLYTQQDRNIKDMQEDDDEADEDDDDEESKSRCGSSKHRTRTVRILSNTAIPRGEWVHIAAVYDGGKASLFVNKSKQSDVKAITGRVRRVSGPLFIGGNGLDATLEETRVSSIARTSFGGTGNTSITYQTVRNYYYSGWRLLEERERKGVVGQTLSAELVVRQFVDGASIDEHLTQDVYAADGTTIAQTYWYHANARNDTVAVTDQAGNVVIRLAYSAYGQAYKITPTGALADLSAEETELVKYGFQGREMDVETGLIYIRHRYYSPEQGRFLQRDPIGYAGGMNLYEFTGGSPHNCTDPMGLDPFMDDLTDYIADLEKRQTLLSYLPQVMFPGVSVLDLNFLEFEIEYPALPPNPNCANCEQQAQPRRTIRGIIMTASVMDGLDFLTDVERWRPGANKMMPAGTLIAMMPQGTDIANDDATNEAMMGAKIALGLNIGDSLARFAADTGSYFYQDWIGAQIVNVTSVQLQFETALIQALNQAPQILFDLTGINAVKARNCVLVNNMLNKKSCKSGRKIVQ